MCWGDDDQKTGNCQGGGGWWGDGLGVWDYQMQTIIYRMDKQQVLLYSTGKYFQYPVINHNGKKQKTKQAVVFDLEHLI